jgi:hypothetical protein
MSGSENITLLASLKYIVKNEEIQVLNLVLGNITQFFYKVCHWIV